MKSVNWEKFLSDLGTAFALWSWVIFLLSLSMSLDLLLEGIVKHPSVYLPGLVEMLWAGCPTFWSGLAIALALVVEQMLMPEVRWSLRYAPFALLGSALIFTSAVWFNLNTPTGMSPDKLPGRLVADVVVSVAVFAIIGYRIVSYRRKKHLG